MNGMINRRHASCPARRYASRGVTLVEILVVMGIVAMLMAIGIPSYKYVTNANRISAEINGLLGDLQFARSEAIKEGRTVSVCVSSDGTSCLTVSPDTNWQKGWIVFSDVNGDGNIDTTTGDLLLRAQPRFKGTDSFSANNTISAITFNREGFASVTNGTLITLHASPVSQGSTRCLSVTLVGLISTKKYGDVDAGGNTCQ
jgi:type IV fimbrial biogenesis protein FimT